MIAEAVWWWFESIFDKEISSGLVVIKEEIGYTTCQQHKLSIFSHALLICFQLTFTLGVKKYPLFFFLIGNKENFINKINCKYTGRIN